jgi:hypothetical protein
MSHRQATVLVCDEILISLTGKFNLLGNYTGDITIQTDPTAVAQLIFYFIIETDVSDLYRSLSVQVTLPESAPITQVVPLLVIAPQPNRSRWTTRYPLLIRNPSLRPGRIEAKVIHDTGEMILNAPWITMSGVRPA